MIRTATGRALWTAGLALFIFATSPALAADPTSPAAPWPIPALLPDGPVRLADGQVLPSGPPIGQMPGSPQAAMDQEHGNDTLVFTPGARPTVPLATAVEAASGPGRGGIAPTGAMAAFGLPNALTSEVFGFLPYWMLTTDKLAWLRYDLLSTIAYFGVAANADGTLATWGNGWSGWNSSLLTGVINTAHARGVRVVLTITMQAWDGGGQQAALLGDASARARLVSAIVTEVRDRAVDGVSLDFEPVPTSLRDQYTSFVRQLKAGLVSGGVGSYLTVCTMAGAATWATGYDLAGLIGPGGADHLFVMGYDFNWSGSARAGGVAPMDSPYVLDVNQAVADHLSVVSPSRIIWGVPYYGRAWRTQSNALNAPTVPGAAGNSLAYYYPANLGLAAQHGRLWDAVGQVPWFAYYDSGAASWVEGYFDDVTSLSAKWDMVSQRGLAGTGIWALLMDQGSSDLWNLLAAKFRRDSLPPAGGITTLPVHLPGDYDGNGTTDLAIWRPSTGTWHVQNGATTQWGWPGDVPVPADYDGNGTTDLAIWRPSTGTWWIRGGPSVQWGWPGDVPVPADYDGNGTTDLAIWRPSTGTWHVQNGATTQWGEAGDMPVPADYDGNGTTDLAIWRPSTGTWWIRGQAITQWGEAGDKPVPADYDGNGTTDLAIWRPSTGTWWIRGGSITQWGEAGDKPVPADYDGNGTTDLAIWRPSTGTWWIRGGSITQWGWPGDVPV